MGTENSSEDLLLRERNVPPGLCTVQLAAECTEFPTVSAPTALPVVCPGFLYNSGTGKPVASCTQLSNFGLTACACGNPVSLWRLQITEDYCQHGHYDKKKNSLKCFSIFVLVYFD